ncbi:MAG TPA: hypothetical protein VJL60_05990 [Gammaproteobacteria bacterium]|nr:hypothetical protein [Gammaproteobacteria bacterium]
MDLTKKEDRHTKWRDIVSEQEKSGLSQSAFCRQRNLVLSKFVYYRGVIKSQGEVNAPQKLFTPVQIKPPESKVTSEIKIILPNGFQCVIPAMTDVSHIRRLMEVLLSC